MLTVFPVCEVTLNWWIDTAPTSTSVLGKWTRQMLLQLGCRPRGFSAHRSGFVSRTCIIGIMQNRGTELPPGLIDMMVRAGGWQAVTGAKTVLRVYARQVIDQHMDLYSMSLGFRRSDADWARKLEAYVGDARWPDKPRANAGRTDSCLQLRVLAWRSPAWLTQQAALNRCCDDIMTAAVVDKDIMPVRGYQELRAAFSHCKKHVRYQQSQAVLHLQQLRSDRQSLWKSCIADVKKACFHSYLSCIDVRRADPSRHLAFRQYFQLLADVEIGQVLLQQHATVVRFTFPDPHWDTKGCFVWSV